MKAVNLIPSDQRAATKSAAAGPAAPSEGTPVGAYAILAALVFAVGAMALLVLTKNDIKEQKAELARVTQEATTVDAQAQTLQAFADFKQLSASRLQTVSGLAESRFPWPHALDDVSRALPEDVYISSLDGSTTTAGTGGSSLRSAIQAPSIELNGCTDSQASVARLMSRLRDVRGVTRVSLAKSESSDTANTAAAPAPATATDGDQAAITTEPCPKGAPPTFDLIVFFERAALSANATPNAGAAQAGPSGPAGAPTGQSGTAAATPTPTTP